MATDRRFANPLDMLKESERGRRYENPIRDTPADVVREQYSKSSRRGKYVSHTFTFTPAQIARIRRIARQHDISLNATARWLIDTALTAVDDGATPELDIVETRREPRLAHG